MSTDDQSHRDDLEAFASLSEPVRRSLYELVVTSTEPVSRDEASEAVDVSRQVAAYHLDRLVDDGLLDVEFRRLTGREGPGAGRPNSIDAPIGPMTCPYLPAVMSWRPGSSSRL